MHNNWTWRFVLALLFALISAPVGLGLQCSHQPNPDTKCQRVNYTHCNDLGFNVTTLLPNTLLGHSTENQTIQFLNRPRNFSSNCSQYLEHFLCATAFPLCARGLFDKVGPCRDMCRAVRESCGLIVLEWLGLNNCNVFPISEGPCIWISSDCTVETAGGNDGNMGEHPVDSTSPGPRGRTNCTGHLTPLSNHTPSTRDASFAGIKQCTEPCQGVYFDKKEQNLIVIWITTWSLLTLFVSAVMFLTYILNFKKIPSLEAPIYYIALCYAISALCYTLSVAIGRGNSLICDSEFTNQFNETAIVVDGLRIPLCASIFGLLYYFIVCTWSWWAVLCIEWLLCSWRFATVNSLWKLCFHIAAWGAPLPFMISAIGLNHVSGDPIMHTCWIKKQMEMPYLIIPLLVCLVLCSIIIIVCFARVVNLQKYSVHRRKSNEPKDYIEHQTLVRVGVYCTVYMLPMGVLLCTYFYEYWFRHQWELDYLQCTVLGSTNCLNRTGPMLPLFLAKITASLLMGILSLLWAIKRSSAEAWKKVCCFYLTTGDSTSSGRYAPNSSSSEQRQCCHSSASNIVVHNGHCSIHKPSFSSESPL